MSCIAGDSHVLDRNRNCQRCGRFIPPPPLVMTRTEMGSTARYGSPASDDSPYILTRCSKCNLKQTLWMEGFPADQVEMQAVLIGWNSTQCCGAPMMTEVHNLQPKESTR